MTNDRIIKAVTRGTASGKLKWNIKDEYYSRAAWRGLDLWYFCGSLYVDGMHIGLAWELGDLLREQYRSREEFESAIMELEDNDE